MRFFAYMFILAGLAFLADAAYDQYRGIASVRYRGVHVASRANKPDEFRSLMAYQWTRASLSLLGGFIILGICRRADRHDPFSPDFAGSDALGSSSQASLKKHSKRHRPNDISRNA